MKYKNGNNIILISLILNWNNRYIIYSKNKMNKIIKKYNKINTKIYNKTKKIY